ncbi:AAA family ATPase [Corynebacterium singulare]|uniref:AAA domain n=1 Tax=Corynebacterium singulare TaxID=161899 RepID=A0A0B6ENX8_9CORY|nr:AAA family ATPase [Corynebacterium singulare]AJI78207.1 AAA domain [Corynebacterium singulare]
MARYPIRRLEAQSFGPFREIDVEFSPKLNIVVGDNSSGKSFFLKLLYTAAKTVKDSDNLTKKEFNSALASKLMGVYRPDALGRLTRRTKGAARANVDITFAGVKQRLSWNFSSRSKSEVSTESLPQISKEDFEDEPIYLPTHELLSLSASFLSFFENYEVDFDETWRDTLLLLHQPALRGPRVAEASKLVSPFSKLLSDGSVVENNGRFYLKQPGIGNLEAPLVAEGHRKLAMLVRLIANGALLNSGYLFWDEPEANLNPASQKAIAHALRALAAAGTQVFVVTHSVFLLRELQMSENKAEDTRYVGLSRDSGDASDAEVVVQSAPELDDLDVIAALDAEVEQAERYLSW